MPCLRRTLLALFAGVVVSLVPAGGALAQDYPCDQQCLTFVLGANSNVCLPATYAPNAFNACGTTFGQGVVKFSVWKEDTRVVKVVSDAFFVQLNAGNTSGVFPGNLQACVNNTNSYALTVNLCQEVRP